MTGPNYTQFSSAPLDPEREKPSLDILDGDDDDTPPSPPIPYVVGKNSPPREYQFEKGRSGNPRGRPRKIVDLDEILERLLLTPVKVGAPSSRRTVAAFEAVIMRLIRQAIDGDVRAAKLLLSEADRIFSIRLLHEEKKKKDEEKKRLDSPIGLLDLDRANRIRIL